MPRSFDDFTQISEGFGADPVLPRGYGANFNDTAYPFDPGPRPALDTGQTASWFYGETLEPDTATLVLDAPGQPGHARSFRGAPGWTGRRIGGRRWRFRRAPAR